MFYDIIVYSLTKLSSRHAQIKKKVHSRSDKDRR